MAHSPSLTRSVLRHALGTAGEHAVDEIRLQDRVRGSGITDILILGPDVHAIVEAKRGWYLPSEDQSSLYVPRLHEDHRSHQVLLTMSEAPKKYAALHLPAVLKGIPIIHLAWKDIIRLSQQPVARHTEKRLLAELHAYLTRIVSMQNPQSSLVYVVSLGSGTPEWSRLSWIDFVEKERLYFHPMGRGGWPKEPPNYIGVRYRGHLQSIHHVDAWEIVDSLERVPGMGPGRNVEGPPVP